MVNPVRVTGKFDTREEWEAEVIRLRKRGVKTDMMAKLLNCTRSSIDGFIKAQERNY